MNNTQQTVRVGLFFLLGLALVLEPGLMLQTLLLQLRVQRVP